MLWACDLGPLTVFGLWMTFASTLVSVGDCTVNTTAPAPCLVLGVDWGSVVHPLAFNGVFLGLFVPPWMALGAAMLLFVFAITKFLDRSEKSDQEPDWFWSLSAVKSPFIATMHNIGSS
jgi:hypothetical protein